MLQVLDPRFCSYGENGHTVQMVEVCVEVAQGRRKPMLLSLVREYILYITSGTQKLFQVDEPRKGMKGACILVSRSFFPLTRPWSD